MAGVLCVEYRWRKEANTRLTIDADDNVHEGNLAHFGKAGLGGLMMKDPCRKFGTLGPFASLFLVTWKI